jgi:hypothetical protein
MGFALASAVVMQLLCCATEGETTADGAVANAVPAGFACAFCATSDECDGAICAQLGGEMVCAAPCVQGYTCSGQSYCLATTGVRGADVRVCVPRADPCANRDRTGNASGTHGNSAYDGGAPVSGSVGPSGGSASRLYFAVVGDTRPPTENDTQSYPSAIITRIYARIESLSPRPLFAISTGDYLFAAPWGTDGATQLDLYLAARSRYSGTLFPAMGNHECTGFTSSNCGIGNPDGLTNNFTAFVSKLLAPIRQARPYYEIDITFDHAAVGGRAVAAADGTWTAKLLFVAANAWNASQAAWLERALSRPTTYTFLVRHEGAKADTAPGVSPSETILRKYPYTLAIVGHSHTYERTGPREVLVGNGGAPLSGSRNYGFALVSQSSDGSVAVDMIDYGSGLADANFHFALHADGSPAP